MTVLLTKSPQKSSTQFEGNKYFITLSPKSQKVPQMKFNYQIAVGEFLNGRVE